MRRCLIGHSGFVGTTLTRQTTFGSLFRSTNISGIRGETFETVVCAAAPAQKWLANKEPEADRAKVESLIGHLDGVRCDHFTLISTVDVFKHSVGVDETTVVDEDGLHPYGLHRRLLERFVENRFENHLVVRLPGLVGPGLRKNVVFDLLNGNNLQAIDSRGVFQFYPMVNLWHDLQLARRKGLRLVHLTAEPLSVADVAEFGFNRRFVQTLEKPPAAYDMRSCHAALFGGDGTYQYSGRESLQAVRAYAQSEPPSERPSMPHPADVSSTSQTTFK